MSTTWRLVAAAALLAACSRPAEVKTDEAVASSNAGAAAPVDSEVRFTSADFASHVARFPRLALPVELPLAAEAVAEIETRPLESAAHQRYLCGTRYFECRSADQGDRFHRAYRFDISSKAIGLLYHGVGPRDTQLVLMTYDASGAIIDGLILAGDFDDRAYGFDGELQAGRIVRNHYVWMEGVEKEYVKDRRFRITETGGIEETIL